MTTKDKIEENSNSAPGFICSFCGKEAIDVSKKDLYFGCPKHIHKAKKETTIELGIIARIGFNEWVKRKPRLKNIICCPVIMENKLLNKNK